MWSKYRQQNIGANLISIIIYIPPKLKAMVHVLLSPYLLLLKKLVTGTHPFSEIFRISHQ
jgi:hypothetical protein